jgi:hypothetical protein
MKKVILLSLVCFALAFLMSSTNCNGNPQVAEANAKVVSENSNALVKVYLIGYYENYQILKFYFTDQTPNLYVFKNTNTGQLSGTVYMRSSGKTHINTPTIVTE